MIQKTFPVLSRTKQVGLTLGILGFIFPFLVDLPGLEPASQRMLAIFLLAICFWITEAIPLVATAVLIIILEIFLLTKDAIVPLADATAKSTDFFGALASPVIILFLGGFMIADGAAKFGLDRSLAAVLLKPFLGSPRKTLLGLMSITAVLSMFMSNTATTATMFAVVIPVLASLPKGKIRTGIALSIPVAANVGGIGTPVGTPPNAIALGALQNAGYKISFVGWMALAVPLMIVVLALAWWWLAFRYIPADATINPNFNASFQKTGPAIVFYVIAGTTVALWMTEPLHGISSNTVGFIPVVLLLATQVMTGGDLKALDWPVLWLVSGGIALGKGVGVSGLDKWLIGSINWQAMSVMILTLALAGIGLAMSNVISHSAAANLLIPLGIGLSASIDMSVMMVAVVLALSTSLGMSLPISTPPNAIAYSTGEIPTKEMAYTGVFIGIVGVLILALAMPVFWNITGLL